MTSKIKGDTGIEFPDGSVQSTAADVGPAFRATNNGGVTTNTTAKVAVTTEQFDTNNSYDTVQSRFTPNVPGYYNITGALSGDALNAGAYLVPKIYKNGASYSNGSGVGIGAGAQNIGFYSTAVTCLVFLNGTTDYVELWSTVIGTPNVNSAEFSGAMVRRA